MALCLFFVVKQEILCKCVLECPRIVLGKAIVLHRIGNSDLLKSYS